MDVEHLADYPKRPDSAHTTIKIPSQEHITIIEDTRFFRSGSEDSKESIDEQPKKPPRTNRIMTSGIYQWIVKQCNASDNRYAFQMGIAFIAASMFVIITPLSKIFNNAFWIGVSVVTVLDNTVGGFLNLSLQRLLGTIIGGVSSIAIMTITRAIFHPEWNVKAEVLLCVLMFVQIFCIAKIKMMPDMAYAGSIGLLTTVIILLSGYSELTHNRLSYTAELGLWRTLNLIMGIVIALLVSLLVFPLKASSVMRKNLGKAMEDAANLYQKSSEFYLDFNKVTSKEPLEEKMNFGNQERPSFIASFFNKPISNPSEPITQSMEDHNPIWTHETITKISDQAFDVMAKLQTESARLRNVSNECYTQSVFRIFGGKEHCKRHMRRARRYNDAIEAMKRITWPLVSFRLLLPLISMSQANQRLEHFQGDKSNDFTALQDRITPTKETLESFYDSLRVMHKLGSILKNYRQSLSEFSEDWVEIDRMTASGNQHIQRELRQIVKQCVDYKELDGLQTLSYYGFLVRCAMIWDGLKTVTEKLSPLNGTLSRTSSMGFNGSLPNRENIPAPE
ncbi:aluminum activated malate transporter-domain-containing protein [Choanephora cucurbitarum]|nr:aluminum activated malate transporter-domain-containing protein [Choanephora cucurbitarum]